MPEDVTSLNALQGADVSSQDDSAMSTGQPPVDKDDESNDLEQAVVKSWLARISAAEKKWEPDFKRMRDNARFAAGWQWNGQTELDEDRYIANITLQMVNQKVASLYARNPTVEWKLRDRLIYQLWDGRLETLAVCIQKAQLTGGMDPASMAVIADYQHGLMVQELTKKVGKTLEILYQWMCDEQEPDFKKQFKSLVRRVITCGVGYVKQEFERQDQNDLLDSTALNVSRIARAKAAQFIMSKLQSGDIDPDDERVYQLKGLLDGLTKANAHADSQMQQTTDPHERLVYNFPKAWNIIPDPCCTEIQDFIGADWVAEKFLMTLDEVNAFFQTDIDSTDVSKLYNNEGYEQELKTFQIDTEGQTSDAKKPKVCVYEVFDKPTKTRFYLLSGWKNFLVEPSSVEPCTKHFWPWFTLTFNPVETCDADGADGSNGNPVSCFPPSDVQQMKSAQKEINRTRDALREHRKANAPRWAVSKGVLTETDKENLQTMPDNAVFETESMVDDISKVIMALPKIPIEPLVYDVTPQRDDVLMTTGLQESNFGIQKNTSKKGETATAASIAEQSKVTNSASNVDDLDCLLSDLALNGGQLLLSEVSINTVKMVVGPGAVWPVANKTFFLNLIFLQCQAASSGRPNQQLDMNNWKILAPMLQQLGANPNAMVRETVRRLGDHLNPDDFFPLVPPQNVPPNGMPSPAGGGGSPSMPSAGDNGGQGGGSQSMAQPQVQPTQQPQGDRPSGNQQQARQGRPVAPA